MKDRIYTVLQDGKTRLVQAQTRSDVRKHLLRDTEIDEADAVQTASMTARGIKVEITNKEVA